MGYDMNEHLCDRMDLPSYYTSLQCYKIQWIPNNKYDLGRHHVAELNLLKLLQVWETPNVINLAISNSYIIFLYITYQYVI